MTFGFRVRSTLDGTHGRSGVISTPHGEIATPAFIAVGTKATVKAVLPEMVADPVLWVLEYMGWLHLPVTRRFSAASRLSLRRLKIEASLKRWRLSSIRYAKERVWVERWLHMIDRSLTKQPAAVAAVVATAEMVQGYGDGYTQNLRDWNLIIDNLVKPTFDGALSCPDLAGAIAEARAAVRPDPQQAVLKRVIAGIRTQAGTGS